MPQPLLPAIITMAASSATAEAAGAAAAAVMMPRLPQNMHSAHNQQHIGSELPQNLVRDPNFEGGIRPAVWMCSVSAFTRVADVVHPPATAAMRESIHDPRVYHLCTQTVNGTAAGRRYNASVWVKTHNVSGSATVSNAAGASLCIEYSRAGPVPSAPSYLSGVYPIGVNGTSAWTQIWTVVTVPVDATTVAISVYMRPGLTGTAWFDGVSLIELPPLPPSMKTSLLSPLYRGRITGAAPKHGSCKSIVLRAQIDYATYDHAASDLVLVVTLSGIISSSHGTTSSGTSGRGAAIETETISGDQIQPMVTVTLKTAPHSLATGRYVIHCVLKEKHGGVVLNVTNHSIVRVADGAPIPAAYFDEQQRLIRNGRATFPLGLYLGAVTVPDLETIGRSKINMIMPYVPPTNLSTMDAIHEHGLAIMFSTKGSYYRGPNQYPAIITSRAKEQDFIKGQVTKFKAHPALLGWHRLRSIVYSLSRDQD
eukprot:COSAG05_NODE_3429_length_2072_cov_1.888495_2_plen_481_part_00